MQPCGMPRAGAHAAWRREPLTQRRVRRPREASRRGGRRLRRGGGDRAWLRSISPPAAASSEFSGERLTGVDDRATSTSAKSVGIGVGDRPRWAAPSICRDGGDPEFEEGGGPTLGVVPRAEEGTNLSEKPLWQPSQDRIHEIKAETSGSESRRASRRAYTGPHAARRSADDAGHDGRIADQAEGGAPMGAVAATRSVHARIRS